MKRNKIFLGVTASLLAVAGIAAAKQQKHAKLLFYTTAGDCASTNICTKSIDFSYSVSGANRLRTSPVVGKVVCYTTVGQPGTCFPAYTGS
jgi:hypothetical protein